MMPDPTSAPVAEPGSTDRVLRGADRFRPAAAITTTRIRRSVSGRIENRGLPGEPIRAVCHSCGQTFVAVAHSNGVRIPCIHCGKLQTIVP